MTNAVNRTTNRMAFNVILDSMKVMCVSILKLLLIEGFELQGYCDFDLWRINPKINRGHLLVMTNLHKLKDPRTMVGQSLTFNATMTLTFDLNIKQPYKGRRSK